MKKLTKVLSLILALLMIATVFMACNKTEDPEKETTDNGQNTTQATTTEGEETTTEIVLPEIDWDGVEYRILGRYHPSMSQFVNFEVWRETSPDDVVGKAVWKRNEALKEKYNFVVKGNLSESFVSIAQTMIKSGEDLYDLIILPPEKFQPHASNGELIDLNTLEYINLNHECWNQVANESLTMGGKLFYTTNKFLLQDKHRAWCLFVNRDLVKEFNLGNIEDMVFEGTWTVEKLLEISKVGSVEYDGIDGRTGADRWGLTFSDRYNFIQLAYGAGFRLCENGTDGYPTLIGATDYMVGVLDKVYEIIWDYDAVWVPGIGNAPDSSGAFVFEQGRAVTHGNCVNKLDVVDLFDFDYGVLPNPKYDEKQEKYYAIPNLGNGCLFAIPMTVSEPERAGFFLEAISEASVDTSYTAYIETKCKLQDVVDQEAAKCLDLIFDGIVYDIGFISNPGGLGDLAAWTLVKSNVNNYARMFDRYKINAEFQITKIKEAYAAMDNPA